MRNGCFVSMIITGFFLSCTGSVVCAEEPIQPVFRLDVREIDGWHDQWRFNRSADATMLAASDHLPIAAAYQFDPTGMLAADFDGDGDDFLMRQNNIPCPPLDPDPDCESDFTKLFDGKTLNGWIGDTKGYVVEDGKLICRSKTGRNLFTAKEYSDFVLRFEFKLTPGANNGLGIRCPLKGASHLDGIELQIMDNTAPRFKNLHPWQYHGSIYGVVSAKRGHLKPVGQWNSQEVTCQGRRIKVILNGVTIVDANVDEASTPKTLDEKPHPGLKRTKGHIGFLGHGDRVEFRNIRIKVLPDQREE